MSSNPHPTSRSTQRGNWRQRGLYGRHAFPTIHALDIYNISQVVAEQPKRPIVNSHVIKHPGRALLVPLRHTRRLEMFFDCLGSYSLIQKGIIWSGGRRRCSILVSQKTRAFAIGRSYFMSSFCESYCCWCLPFS